MKTDSFLDRFKDKKVLVKFTNGQSAQGILKDICAYELLIDEIRPSAPSVEKVIFKHSISSVELK